MDNKLKTKDLISAGIFGAMYIIVMVATVTVVGFIPITYIFAPFFAGITCGTVYMLYIMKVPKRGAILILSILVGLVILSGTWISGVYAVICGIIAEILFGMGNYKSMKFATASFCAFACTTVGPFLAILIAKDSFLASVVQYYGQEYADKLDALTPSWIILVLIALGIIGGFIGATIGKKILKKHFEKAGVV
ncbi:MptD family putative ECF transporter S component [Alkalibaculum sp. M08DMB]|uniref:MptD family putative ECF transporter S component n=1 Tax=Alkalibaculum sporogenes TaxID=2655001 RepID=A0A6A7KAF1_9FIRM|nr:MptD family putative ECF transporter S component [Alkalibaculum sporogenes]MPW26480.1 MptD family putative ECF transporter S component [Alkalibaculum sporogenes]